ncbi:hypothetical protein MTR_8g069555 [Medicago truncatula]|uniref:Uncharacterized protein n=1 Tax=Medicago truncatula TaxID=3880 RepID=A0A072TTI6_MEDTR|nr:hypothetical protein MTR_8g069555 [Medicago truncatula]
MDGEGEEWSRLASSGVVVDVVRWFCFGWEKKKEERASDERERGRCLTSIYEVCYELQRLHC